MKLSMQKNANNMQLNFDLYFFSTQEGGRQSAILNFRIYRAPILFGLNVSKEEIIKAKCDRKAFIEKSSKIEIIDAEFDFLGKDVSLGSNAKGTLELHYTTDLVRLIIEKHYPIIVFEYNIVAWGYLYENAP